MDFIPKIPGFFLFHYLELDNYQDTANILPFSFVLNKEFFSTLAKSFLFLGFFNTFSCWKISMNTILTCLSPPFTFNKAREFMLIWKKSLSVTGFEPAISRFVAERVIRCATRMSWETNENIFLENWICCHIVQAFWEWWSQIFEQMFSWVLIPLEEQFKPQLSEWLANHNTALPNSASERLKTQKAGALA